MRVGWQLLRFVVTGVTSLCVDLLALQGLLAAGVEQFVAVALAFLAGVVVNLLMHKYFTFRDGSRLDASQVARYLGVVAINLAMTEAIVWAATAQLHLQPLTGKFLSLPPVLMVGFVLSRTWVFAPRAGRG